MRSETRPRPVTVVVVLTLAAAALGATTPWLGSADGHSLRPGLGNPPGGASLGATPTAGRAPLLVHFNLTLPNGTPPALAWSFGDGAYLNGSASEDRNPAHVYLRAGTYNATVEATWSAGSENLSIPIDVVAENLTASVTATPSVGTAPLTVTLSASPRGGTGTYVAFVWRFGDGGVGSGLSVRYTYEAAGDFLASFTVNDSAAESAGASVWVNVTAAPSSPANHSGAPKDGTNSTRSTVPNIPPPQDPSGRTPEFRVLSLTLPVAGVALGAGIGVLLFVGAWVASSRRWLRAPVARSGTSIPPENDVVAASSLAHVPEDPVRRSRTGSSSELTGGQLLTFQLVRHLASLPRVSANDVPRRAMTQAGIAETLGVGPSAVSRVLKRLAATGLVTSESAHVPGVDRRVRVYRLTEKGERLGRALRESMGPPPAP